MTSKPKISIIAAIAKNRAIGKDNKLLWHIPEDLKRFKALTSGHAIIMGSRTFESLGKPLPNRTNIVIAKGQDYQAPRCTVAHSIDEALAVGEDIIRPLPADRQEIFIIGGGSIYAQFLPMADKLYLTMVEKEFEADTFFPPYEDLFTKAVLAGQGEYNGLKYKFLELEKQANNLNNTNGLS
ncbi:MAG: dihydrofolate reductase [Patescibacteria group bacterium]|nr:dihydrofolate reductase [Patescibacteria group bacterium]